MRWAGGGVGGCRDWNITKEKRGRWRVSRKRGGRGQTHHVMMKRLQAAVLGRQTETSPHIDAAVSTQQLWEMAAVCAAATIYMGLIQPAYRFHHQLQWLV